MAKVDLWPKFGSKLDPSMVGEPKFSIDTNRLKSHEIKVKSDYKYKKYSNSTNVGEREKSIQLEQD